MKKFLRLVLLGALLVPLGARAQLSFPVTMGFEDETAFGQWSMVACNGSTGRNATAYSGGYGFAFHWSTTPPQYLISPEFEVATGSEMLTFWYKDGTSYSEEFSVGFSSTTNDTTAFTWGTLVSVPANTPWTEYTAMVPAGTKYMAIRCSSDDQYYLYIDDIRIGAAPTCFRVQDISVSDITSESVTISWVDNVNTNTTYTLYYTTGDQDTVFIPGLSGDSYELTGLEAQTLYQFFLVPDCSEGDILPVSISAKTDCLNGSCNVTINAADTYGDGWNGNRINVFQGGALSESVTLLSGSEGTFPVRVCSGDTVVFIFSENNYASEMRGSITDGGGHEVFIIDASIAGADTLAVLPNPCPNCINPTGLTSSVNEDGEIVFSWTGTAPSYIVYAGDSLYPEEVYDTFYVFNDLSASTIYQLGVASVCGSDEGDTSGISRLQVLTPCGSISGMPWSVSFESDEDGTIPACWTRVNAVEDGGDFYPAIYVYSYYASSGTHSLAFKAQYEDDTCLIVTSPIVYTPNNIHVKYWVYPYLEYDGRFDAGMMTNPNDPSSFHVLKSLDSDSPEYETYEYTMFEFFTDSLDVEEGDTVWLAFRLVGDEDASWQNYVYLDDVSMRAIPNCRMPFNGSGVIDSVDYQSAYFAWGGVSEDGYVLKLTRIVLDSTGSNIVDSVISYVESPSTSIVVDTLMPNTIYYASVASVCDVDGEMDTTDYLRLGSFRTQKRCYPVYKASLDALTSNAAIVSWHYRPNMGIAGRGAVLTLTDMSNATMVETFTSDSTKTYSDLVTGHTYRLTFNTLCGSDDTADVQTIYFTPHAPACAQAFTDAEATTVLTSAPVYSYSTNYSYSQVVYSDTVLAGIDTLSGVALKPSFGSEGNVGVNNFTMDLYVGYVDTSLLTGYNNDYFLGSAIPADSLKKVVDGYHLSVTNNNWVYIPFDSLFAVSVPDPGKRFVVTYVTSHDSRENGSNSWLGVNRSVSYGYYQYLYYARYAYSSNSPINPNSVSGYTTSNVANMQFFGNCGGSCLAPVVTLTDVGSNRATVAWLANGDETSWRVEYKAAADSVWTLATTATASPYTITGLNANTGYQVRVGAVCADTVTYSGVSFTTLCAAVTIPYSHSFTAADACWMTNISYHSASGVNVYDDYYLISPELPAPVSSLMAVITDRCYNTSASNQGYYVAIGDANGGNLTIIDTVYATEGTEFGTHSVYFNNYTGNYNHIYIAHTNGDVYIKDILVKLAPHCTPATNLTLDSTSLYTLGLSWNSNANSFQVKYRVAGDSSAWNTVVANNSNIVLTGLVPSTRYEVEVRPVCPDSTLSEPISGVFATECIVYNTPYEVPEFYEMPICWTTYNTGHPQMTWYQSIVSGYGYIYSNAGSSSSATNDWLMSAAIAIPTTAAADSVMLVYQIGGITGGGSNSIARCDVMVAPTAGESASDFTDTLAIETNLTDTFAYRRISLAQYAGDTIRVAFRNTSVNNSTVAMVDFGVRSVLTPRYRLAGSGTAFTNDTNLYRAVFIEGDANSDTFVWTSTMAASGNAVMFGANTDSMQIVYSAAGYDTIVCVVSNSHGSDTNRGVVRVFEIAPVNTFPYFTGFDSTDIDNSNWVILNGNNGWMIGDSVNNGGNASMFVSNDGGTNTYDNTATTISYAYRAFDMNDSGMYNIRFDWKANGESTYDFLRVWLIPASHFNIAANTYPGGVQNMYTLSSATISGWKALGGSKLNLSQDWQTILDSVQITTPGRYFLTFMWANDHSEGSNPPAAIDNVYVNNGSIYTCPAPVLGDVVAGEDSLIVNFTAQTDSVELIIVEGALFDASANSVIVSGNNYAFTGLTHSSLYTFGIRALCSEEDVSEWVIVSDSTLVVNCGVPTALTVDATTYSSATFSWTVAGEESAWQVHVFNAAGFDQTYTTQTSNHTVDGLSSGVTYNVAVRAMCGMHANIEGDWSDTINVTTDVCQPVSNVMVDEITKVSARVNWTSAATDNSTWKIEYGPAGFSQGSGTSLTVQSKPYTLTGLEAGTSYDVYVANICTETVSSNWSDRVNFETETELGINDVNADAISLYPNPANSTVTVSGLMGSVKVSIVDMNGRTVATADTKDDKVTFDLSSMAQGAYFVRIVGEQCNSIRKLVVK